MTSAPARASRRNLPRDERIWQILAVTRAMLREKGHDGIVTSEVADRCGISEATIYKYFESKRDLLIQVAVQWFEELLSEKQPRLTGRSTRATLRTVVGRILTVMHRDPEMTRFVLLDLRQDPGYRKMPIFDLNRRFAQQLTEVLQNGIAQGELHQDVSVRLLRDMIFGCVEHQTWAYQRGEGSFSVDEVAESIVTVIYRGMAIAPAAPASDIVPTLSDAVQRLERVASRLEKSASSGTQENQNSTTTRRARPDASRS
jgi:TetR/AcrR family transcriptional regulator, fatty acid metabolism regulator protein